MELTEPFLQELDMEAKTTRRVLERVPEDKLDWRPHPKSFSLGQLSLHIAASIGQISHMLTMESMEIPSFQQPEAESRQQILDTFDASLATARETLASIGAPQLSTALPIQKGGVTVMEFPRVALIRQLMLNHQYHHRGQLSVYLRMVSAAVPSIYGPSADEAMM